MGQRENGADTSVLTSDNGPRAAEQSSQERLDGLAFLLEHLSRRPEPPRLVLVVPKQFADCRIVGDALASGDMVLLDARLTEEAVARRVVDFASGATYTLSGSINLIANRVYLLEPGISTAQTSAAQIPTTRAPTTQATTIQTPAD